MALTAQQWKIVERRTGVPERVMKVLLGYGERSAQGSVSPMGATGRAQLMPGTARNLERKYKINTKTEFGNVLGGAYYLAEQKRTFKNWRLAFAAYNAGPGAVQQYHGVPPYKETQDYVRRTMQALGAAAPDTTGTPGTPGSTTATITSATPDIAALASENMTHIAAGDFSPTKSFNALAEATQAAEAMGSMSSVTTPGTPGTPGAPGTAAVSAGKDWWKWISVPAGAGSGPRTKAYVLQWAAGLGKAAGEPLQAMDNTLHSKYTVDGNISAHSTGDAVDIAAEGERLIRLGQLALIRAGMPRKKALKQTGGLFNVGRWQIIFNTHIGGDHTNHVHVGHRR